MELLPGTLIGPWPMSWMHISASSEPEVSMPPRGAKTIEVTGTEKLLPPNLIATSSAKSDIARMPCAAGVSVTFCPLTSMIPWDRIVTFMVMPDWFSETLPEPRQMTLLLSATGLIT
jgi:hypothetical protein